MEFPTLSYRKVKKKERKDTLVVADQEKEKWSINWNSDQEVLWDSPYQNSLRAICVYFSAVQTKQVKSQTMILNQNVFKSMYI